MFSKTNGKVKVDAARIFVDVQIGQTRPWEVVFPFVFCYVFLERNPCLFLYLF